MKHPHIYLEANDIEIKTYFKSATVNTNVFSVVMLKT